MSDIEDAGRRRQTALLEKLRSLKNEAEAWEKLKTLPGFEIHTSQIVALCGVLEALQARIVAQIGSLEYPNGRKPGEEPLRLPLAQVAEVERRILAALEIWNAYREKFAFRMIEEQRQTLSLLDDFAWHAYLPVRNRVISSGSVTLDAVRQPPLVFPNPRWSPFARSREQRYELNETSGNWAALDDLEDWLRALPVPLIGIPWYQLAHLPDAVFIGHEVGHLVEEDFQLEEPLRAAILAALPPLPGGENAVRRTAWSRHWRSEVFADIYGVLTSGPAYARILLDTLHGDAIETERQPDSTKPSAQQWSAYPTRWLRACLVCEAVKQLPDNDRTKVFTTSASRLLDAWCLARPRHAMQDYEEDVPKVVNAILSTAMDAFAGGTPRAAQPLTDVVAFTAGMQCKAAAEAQRALDRDALVESDDRVLIAAAALAFVADPVGAASVDVSKRFRARLLATRSEEVRAGTEDPERDEKTLTPQEVRARHERIATALWEQFSKPAQPNADSPSVTS